MSSLKSVDQAKLNAWQRRLPPRLGIFLESFFLGCRSDQTDARYEAFMRDIELYAGAIPVYRDHRDELQTAFYDITGRYKERHAGLDH